MTVDQLLDTYQDGLDSDDRLSAKTRFDYRSYAQAYVGPSLPAARFGTSHRT
jgi:hypothetical protein